jgi:7-dehydrocholesterol reductase
MSLRRTLLPALLIPMSASSVFLVWYTTVYLDGSVQLLFEEYGSLAEIWSPYMFGSMRSWLWLVCFSVLELTLMTKLPGKLHEGPKSPTGHVPVYRDNGLYAYAVTVGLWCTATHGLGIFSPSLLYDIFPELLGALTLASFSLCFYLLFKGTKSGNLLFDWYWGTELYPYIAGINVKHFLTCRFGMMLWPLLLLSFVAKQQELYGTVADSMAVSVGLQLVYITKFFVWETGYLHSLDIMHDRAGYYLCWGVMTCVPGIYTSTALYLVTHPNNLGSHWSLLIGVVGTACIMTNYWVDYQRQLVRNTNGNCTIWGEKPVLIETSHSLLLASGWWGVSRHFNYVPEVLAALLWSVPALFSHLLPYFYVCCLTILLVDRAHRDDRRCREKYGLYWDAYCEKVPWMLVPHLL